MGFFQAHLTGAWEAADEPASAKQLAGMVVVEAQTDADATSDDLTFTEPITAVEIYHAEATAQEFVVNGLTLTIGPGGWRSLVGGVPSVTVSLPTGVTCAVSRCV